MKNRTTKVSLQLLTLITTPKLAEKASALFQKRNLPVQYRLYAEGTASSEIMDLLGLGSIDKYVIVTTVPRHVANEILSALRLELQMHAVNSGIAFTIPLNGANTFVLHMLTHALEIDENSENGKDEETVAEYKHALIAAIVNRGFSGDVMNAAKSAGARGGTVVHSHHIANKDAAGFWGLNVQEEKEIVMILSEADSKLAIMQSISEKCGMHSEAQGLVMSMPIDAVTGI